MKQEMPETLKLVIGEVLSLCFPVCPDNAIPVNKELKREDFNYDYCKGCGVCAKVCPFAAIIME